MKEEGVVVVTGGEVETRLGTLPTLIWISLEPLSRIFYQRKSEMEVWTRYALPVAPLKATTLFKMGITGLHQPDRRDMRGGERS